MPRQDVDDAVAAAFDRYNVAELACDPWGWQSDIERWSKRRGARKVLEWPTHAASRMGPATDRMYQAVTDGLISHDGHARLAQHLANCVARPSPYGDLVAKDRRGSPRKIDATVAAIVTLDRSAWHFANTRTRRVVVLTR